MSFRWCLARAAAVALIACGATPALATGDISCEATDGSGAWINVGVSHLPILTVLSASATDGQKTWSTHVREDETAIVFGQGFQDDRQILIDFTDPNMQEIVISLRLFHASGENTFAEAGTLSFGKGSAYPVQCTNG